MPTTVRLSGEERDAPTLTSYHTKQRQQSRNRNSPWHRPETKRKLRYAGGAVLGAGIGFPRTAWSHLNHLRSLQSLLGFASASSPLRRRSTNSSVIAKVSHHDRSRPKDGAGMCCAGSWEALRSK